MLTYSKQGYKVTATVDIRIYTFIYAYICYDCIVYVETSYYIYGRCIHIHIRMTGKIISLNNNKFWTNISDLNTVSCDAMIATATHMFNFEFNIHIEFTANCVVVLPRIGNAIWSELCQVISINECNVYCIFDGISFIIVRVYTHNNMCVREKK